MKLAARPSLSMTPIHIVSPGPLPLPHGAALPRSILAASSRTDDGARNEAGSTLMYAGSVMC